MIRSGLNARSSGKTLAGLTEEQAEVSFLCSATHSLAVLTVCQFREAVTQFAEKEVAPRAAEIDKSNNFPSVRASNVRF